MSSSDLKIIKPLLTKGILFLSPLFLMALIVAFIDPFGFLGISLFVRDQIKKDYAIELDCVLWKSIQFEKQPMANILLGDSRMGMLDVNTIQQTCGEPYFNFAYGGGTLAEAIDTFWFAANKTKLKNVYINTSLTICNSANNRNRFSDTRLILNHPIMYVINPNVIEAGYYELKAQLFHHTTRLGQPSVGRQAFWKQQLNDNLYYKYGYPSQQIAELKKISDYCMANHIHLTFLILPTHVDLQRKILEYHLEEADRTYRKDLENMGHMLDYDYPCPLTQNYDNFADPFHFNRPTGVLVIQDIWGPRHAWAKESGLPIPDLQTH